MPGVRTNIRRFAMNTKAIASAVLTVSAIVGGLVYANSRTAEQQVQQVSKQGYICPVTGEELPCEHCCPLKLKN